MSTERRSVLVVAAHHDDVELGCGGTISRLLREGHEVAALVMTHSGYSSPTGELVRGREDAAAEAMRAAELLGHELVTLDEDTLDIPVSDASTARIVRLAAERDVDVLLTHWHGDIDPPHQNVNRMVLRAARRVGTVLGFQVNWQPGVEPFAPHVYVSIEEEDWERKLAAYRLYESEARRHGEAYADFHDRLTRQYGAQSGVPRAEGFTAYKLRWDP